MPELAPLSSALSGLVEKVGRKATASASDTASSEIASDALVKSDVLKALRHDFANANPEVPENMASFHAKDVLVQHAQGPLYDVSGRAEGATAWMQFKARFDAALKKLSNFEYGKETPKRPHRVGPVIPPTPVLTFQELGQAKSILSSALGVDAGAVGGLSYVRGAEPGVVRFYGQVGKEEVVGSLNTTTNKIVEMDRNPV